MVSSELFSPRMISTSGIRCTGLKKCIPQKFSGRSGRLPVRQLGWWRYLRPARFPGALSARFPPVPLFDFRIFDYRFDNNIYAIETGIIESRVDGRNDARQLQTADLAALQLFVQQLGRFGHAEVQRFIVDIFHDDRYAFPCRLVSDTAAHNARAQYGCLFRRLNIFGQLFGFTFTY